MPYLTGDTQIKLHSGKGIENLIVLKINWVGFSPVYVSTKEFMLGTNKVYQYLESVSNFNITRDSGGFGSHAAISVRGIDFYGYWFERFNTENIYDENLKVEVYYVAQDSDGYSSESIIFDGVFDAVSINEKDQSVLFDIVTQPIMDEIGYQPLSTDVVGTTQDDILIRRFLNKDFMWPEVFGIVENSSLVPILKFPHVKVSKDVEIIPDDVALITGGVWDERIDLDEPLQDNRTAEFWLANNAHLLKVNATHTVVPNSPDPDTAFLDNFTSVSQVIQDFQTVLTPLGVPMSVGVLPGDQKKYFFSLSPNPFDGMPLAGLKADLTFETCIELFDASGTTILKRCASSDLEDEIISVDLVNGFMVTNQIGGDGTTSLAISVSNVVVSSVVTTNTIYLRRLYKFIDNDKFILAEGTKVFYTGNSGDPIQWKHIIDSKPATEVTNIKYESEESKLILAPNMYSLDVVAKDTGLWTGTHGAALVLSLKPLAFLSFYDSFLSSFDSGSSLLLADCSSGGSNPSVFQIHDTEFRLRNTIKYLIETYSTNLFFIDSQGYDPDEKFGFVITEKGLLADIISDICWQHFAFPVITINSTGNVNNKRLFGIRNQGFPLSGSSLQDNLVLKDTVSLGFTPKGDILSKITLSMQDFDQTSKIVEEEFISEQLQGTLNKNEISEDIVIFHDVSDAIVQGNRWIQRLGKLSKTMSLATDILGMQFDIGENIPIALNKFNYNDIVETPLVNKHTAISTPNLITLSGEIVGIKIDFTEGIVDLSFRESPPIL